jgi:CheY-like chemotaxis protein
MTEQVTVLVVDDQPPNLRLLNAVLSPNGYRVITASSGEQALELLHSSGIDLVLLDIVMPGIDGYEVCRRIRSEPSTAFLPVIMITASGGQEKTQAIKAGADDFINKPFHQGELLARVASWLGSSGTTTPSLSRRLSWLNGMPSSRPESQRNWRSWSTSIGCDGSSLLRWPNW